MGGDGVGQAAVVADFLDGRQHFAGNAFVELGELVELRQQGAAQRFAVGAGVFGFGHRQDLAFEMAAVVVHAEGAGAEHAFDQHFDRAVGQLQHLHDFGDGAGGVHIIGIGRFVVAVALGKQEHRRVGIHGGVERGHGFFAADKQRQHHVRVNHHVAQRQGGQGMGFRSVGCIGHRSLVMFGFVRCRQRAFAPAGGSP